jgi:hypothetical protein
MREDRFTVREKIAVLLAEYNTLRQEVIAARTNLGQGFHVFSVVVMADIVFLNSSSRWDVAIIIFILALAYLGVLCAWNDKNTASFTRRLRELELEINSVAGEPLMLWETIHGWGKIFGWGKSKIFQNPNPNFRDECYAKPEAPLDSGMIEALMRKTGARSE